MKKHPENGATDDLWVIYSILRYEYEHETFKQFTTFISNFRVNDPINVCSSSNSGNIAMYYDDYDGKPDKYFRQNFFIHRLGNDNRKLALGIQTGY
jgi:hypothetical protein